MDLSLDDYIVTKQVRNTSKKSQGKGRPSVQSRLGSKRQPGPKPNQLLFKVAGTGNTQRFDARQRLGNKPKLVDARDKILQKTKFADARHKIQNKQGKPGVIQLVQNKTFDARTKLRTKKQPVVKSRLAASPVVPRVTVTAFGRMATTSSTPVAATQGHLFKTVENNIAEDDNLQYEDDELGSYTEDGGAFNATITIKNPAAIQKIQAPTEPAYKVRGPIIQISNDKYARPSPKTMTLKARPIPVITTQQQEDFMMEAIRTVPKRLKAAPIRSSPSPVEYEEDVEAVSLEDVVSPLQGFRVLITNLHPVVTQDDIIELFGSVGPLKRAKLIKQGLGEVVFVHREDAMSSVKKYHNRELDGVPMQVRLTSGGPGVVTPPRAAIAPKLRLQPSPVRLQPPPPTPAPEIQQDTSSLDDELLSTPASIPQPLRLGKSSPKAGGVGALIDIGVVHKALFKSKAEESPSRPVTFTVKI